MKILPAHKLFTFNKNSVMISIQFCHNPNKCQLSSNNYPICYVVDLTQFVIDYPGLYILIYFPDLDSSIGSTVCDPDVESRDLLDDIRR